MSILGSLPTIDELKAEAEGRRQFLQDKSPKEVLLWIMRSGSVDPRIQADVAIALLPYMHSKKDAIDPSDDQPEE